MVVVGGGVAVVVVGARAVDSGVVSTVGSSVEMTCVLK